MSIVTKESNPELYNVLFPDDKIKMKDIVYNCENNKVIMTKENHHKLMCYIHEREQRINKAIEYLDNLKYVFSPEELKQILKGESDE